MCSENYGTSIFNNIFIKSMSCTIYDFLSLSHYRAENILEPSAPGPYFYDY